MLKLKKIFLLGLLTAAVGMVAMSCTEPAETTDYYSVKVYGGSGSKMQVEAGTIVSITANDSAGFVFKYWESSTSDVVFKDSSAKTTTFAMPEKDVVITAQFDVAVYTVDVVGGEADYDDYEEGETVNIVAAEYRDSTFLTWTTSSVGVTFVDAKKPETSFKMPARNVVVTANYAPVPEYAAVRFTWELKEQSKIQSIAASADDFKRWYEEVYMKEDYIEEDATTAPTFEGSPDVPDNIYSRTLHSVSGSPYKSKYFAISEGVREGKYSAVCTVDDPRYENIADIVANYDVSAADDNVFFEIAFDVGTFLEGEDDLGWFDQKRDNPYDDPRLEKAKAKKLVKKINKGYVTYYILHRARK